MVADYTTLGVHPRDQSSFWTEVISRSLFQHEFRSPTRHYFGALRVGKLGRLGLTRGGGDACEIQRSARDTSDGADALVLCFRVAGRALVEQGGSEFIQGPGTMTLTDMAQPLKHIYPTRSLAVTVAAPREALTARLGNSSAFCTRPISAGSPVAGLAFEFISLLFDRLDSLDQTAGDRLAEQALDLIALAFTTERGQAQPALSSSRATTLLRLKALIEARLSDPALKPEAVAAEAGFSVRYANELLGEENFSLERYIVHRRLERCRTALEDPQQAHRMIGEIAFSWGFSDLSHFTRRFRAAFGMTPGDCRRAQMTTKSPSGVLPRT